MHPVFVWCWFSGDTHSCLRDIACRLLQCNLRYGSEDNNMQATTSVKRCCASRQRHQQVWPGTVTTDAPGVTLAGHSRETKLQAGSADLHYMAVSMLRCTSSTDRTSTSSQHLRSAGICCCWSDDVQRSATWSTRSCSQHNNLQTVVEDASFLCISARLEQ